MNEKLQAAQDLAKLGKMLKGVIALKDDLEKLGNVETTKAMLEASIADLSQKEALLKASMSTLSLQAQEKVKAMEKEEKSFRQILSDAEKASTISANERAAKIIQDAKRDAQKILDEAHEEVRAIGVGIAGHEKDLALLKQQVREEEGKLNSLKRQIAELVAKVS